MVTLLIVIGALTLLIIAGPVIALLVSLFGAVVGPLFMILFPILLIGGLAGYFIGKKGDDKK